MNEYYKDKVRTMNNFLSYNELDINSLMHDWSEEKDFCLRVLNDSLLPEDTKYINDKLDLNHLKDNRTPTEYATELICAWIIEDAIVELFNTMGHHAELNSKDKNREFLSKPSSTADIILNYSKIEIVKDYGGYWDRTNTVELRDNKFLNLKKEDGGLLGLDFQNSKFFLMDLKDIEGEYISYHYPYGKPAYSIQIPNFHSFTELGNEIVKYSKYGV